MYYQTNLVFLFAPISNFNYIYTFFQVKIMLPWDPNGKIGPKRPLPDNVSVVEPKEEVLPLQPSSDIKAIKPDAPVVPIVV